MKIIFAGQPNLSERTAALSPLLARAGHEVTVLEGAARTSPRLRTIQGVRLKRVPSRLPGQLGEWLYTLAAVLRASWAGAGVIHIHGWKLAAAAPLLAALAPGAVIVWTVDSLPARPRWLLRFVARRAQALAQAVTVTRRDLQWHLLEISGVRAEYIPDGYSESDTPLISPRRWKLWTGRYIAATAESKAELAFLAQAYAKVRSRKKLVVLTSKAAELSPLSRKHPFITLVETESPRVARSLMQGAAAIILGSRRDTLPTLLSALRCGKPVVAVAEPFHEETLGVCAQYVKEGDSETLRRSLATAGRNARQADKGRVRAEAHFRWERILLDYLHLYQPAVFLVPIDSAQGVKFSEPVVN
ncbi:MAG: glycosyltransferase [Patescibacteria group bacterium]